MDAMETVYYQIRSGTWVLVDDEGHREFFDSEAALLAAHPTAERMD